MSRLLPRFTREDHLEAEQKIARIVLETAPTQPVTVNPAGGDTRQLRGIPAIARGVSGTQPGSHPERDGVARAARRNAPSRLP